MAADDGRYTPQPGSLLEWREFFGSSVSLGADLLSIYDDARRSLDVHTACNGVDVARSCAAADYNFIVEVDGDLVEMLPAEEHSNNIASDSGSTRPADRQTVAATGLQRGCLDADERACKRPLSVSSTSSSMSSTSSLPRHERKKLATAVQTPLHGVEDASPGCGDGDAGCLSTVAEYVPAATERCRLVVNAERPSPARTCLCDGGADVASPSTEARGDDDNDDDDDAGVGGKTATTLSRSQYVGRVVAEIIDTERAYVADLDQIIHGYLHKIKETPGMKMSTDDISALFGNIESIYSFNRKLLTSLENCSSDPAQVADCFVRLNDGFVVYSDYCTNYPRSVQMLTQCMADAEMAASLRRQQTCLQHGLPLGSYLLKPVQRILKYHILLQNIVNNHDAVEQGHEMIERALQGMVGVARSINEMRRQHENAVRVQEIQSHLYGWDGADLTTLGDLVLEEKFRMCGARAFRHVFLFKRAIIIAKKKAEALLLVKAFIMCSNLMLIESIPREPLAFHLVPFDSPRVQYTLQAMKLEQKRLWCQHIKTLILDNYEAVIPDKAKELVMMLGRSRYEDANALSGDVDEPVKKQHDAPEYLERRRGRRRSNGFIHELKFRPLSLNGLRKSDSSMLPDTSGSQVVVSKGLSMLEEDEQSASHDNGCAVHASASNTDDSGVRSSHSLVSCQESNFDSNSVERRDSLTDDSTAASVSTDVQSVCTRVASGDLTDEDPWLPFSTKSHSPVHSSARNNSIGSKTLSNSHLHCCSTGAIAVPHFAAGYDSETSGAERCAASANLQCRCGDQSLQKVPETRTVDVDKEVHPDAALRRNLAEIKEELPVNCFDTERAKVTGANHLCSTDCVHHSCGQSNLDHFPSIGAEDSPCTSCHSPLPRSGPRSGRKASLSGLKKAVKNVLVHRTSLISDPPANLDDCDRSLSPFESFMSGFSDHSRKPDSMEKSPASAESKRLSKIDRHHYFGSGRRGHRSSLAVDSVRRSLTHLLRTADHGSSVVGERMAASCLERPASSTLTLPGTRRIFGRMLSGNFDDVDASETFRLQSELSRTLSGTDDQSDDESDGVTTTTTTHLSELDTSDSFYESRLFDALEAQEINDVGGFDTDSSDDGTYSTESFSDLAPSDDQPTSSASSHRSVDVDDPSGRTVPRQSDPALTDDSGHHHAPVAATSHLLHQTVRQRSNSDAKSRRLTTRSRCSWTALQQPSIIDSASPQQRWKRLSL